jgi:hypothetical protein
MRPSATDTQPDTGTVASSGDRGADGLEAHSKDTVTVDSCRLEEAVAGLTTQYLLSGFALGNVPGGGPKQAINVAAGAKCSPYKLFGTWTGTLE